MYPGQEKEVAIAVVWNILICNEAMKESVAYDILKTVFGHIPELVTVHKDAAHIKVESQAEGSPIPLHPGALKFFKEKGVKFP
jgi:hypothetical protein